MSRLYDIGNSRGAAGDGILFLGLDDAVAAVVAAIDHRHRVVRHVAEHIEGMIQQVQHLVKVEEA